MFWKRKGKKKNGEEPGAEAETSAVTTKTGDESADTPEPADTAEPADTVTSGADDTEATDGASDDGASEGTEATDGSADTERDDTTDSESVAKDADDADDDTENTTAAAEPADTDNDVDDDGSEDDSASATAAADDAGNDESAGDDDADATEDSEPEALGATEPDSDGIQRVRTAGVLTLDEGEFDVVSNTWIVDADDEGVIVVDPAHDATAILDAVGEREIYLVVCTNGYNNHVSAAIEVAERDDAPIALHPRELRAWRRVHGAERRPDHEIEGGGTLEVGDLEVDVLATPGTANGSVGLYISERGVVLTGDTLRKGELGTVGEGYLDYTRQLHSVGEVLLSLPPDTRVLPDSGPETTVEKESKNFDSWVSTS